MAKNTSLSGLTCELAGISNDIKATIISKGILERSEEAKDDFSKYASYITDTIISNFENNLKTVFRYPQTIVDYIYRRFSFGGYYFCKKYQNGDYKTAIEDSEEIRLIFRNSKITYEGVEYDIAYFPILNLTNFNEINDLFRDNHIVIGIPKIIYDSAKVKTLEKAFLNCWNLHYINLEAEGETSCVSFNNMFKGCTVLEDFNCTNIIPTNITGLADDNDVKSDAINRLNLTQIKTVSNIGYTYSKTGNGHDFIINAYMPICMNALNFLSYGTYGAGNLTFGVGCVVNSGTFGFSSYAKNVGIISGLTTGVNLVPMKLYSGLAVHNFLYSVATDVRTYGHPDDSNPEKIRTLTFYIGTLEGYTNTTGFSTPGYYNTEYYTNDLTEKVHIQDELTESNTLKFDIEGEDKEAELESLNNAITASTTLKKPIKLYDAIYNTKNNTRYYVRALDVETVTDFHKCDFEEIVENNKNMARLDSGTIFELMEKRGWTYEGADK